MECSFQQGPGLGLELLLSKLVKCILSTPGECPFPKPKLWPLPQGCRERQEGDTERDRDRANRGTRATRDRDRKRDGGNRDRETETERKAPLPFEAFRTL